MKPNLPGIFLSQKLILGLERFNLWFEEPLFGLLDFQKNEVEQTFTARKIKYFTSPHI